MKKYLEKLKIFKFGLSILSFFANKGWFDWVRLLTNATAKLNLLLNKPQKATTTLELAETWVNLMPPDGRDLFKIKEITEDTAVVEIQLHCPLRDTGNVQACYELMNYDRVLMKKVGGNLVVLESQSNSGKPFCKLAIRKEELPINDLVPAHLNSKTN